MASKRDRVVIVGLGLAGPLLAAGLLNRGIEVEVFERRPDMRKTPLKAGRSINLAVSARGIYALSQAGLWETVRGTTTVMKGRLMHSTRGELTFQPYGKDESEVIYSISRAELNLALIQTAESRGSRIHFGRQCMGLDAGSGTVRLQAEETGQEQTIQAQAVIGADGATSAIRQEMLKSGLLSSSQQYLDYGYKELVIPAGPKGEYRLEPHALHIWPRGSYMLIALPNQNGSFACILFLPFEGGNGFSQFDTESKVLDFFQSNFPDVVPLMPSLASHYFENPIGSMVTVKCFPWQANGKVLLLGDAAHAIVPFFGQGMNCAFEDCTCLLEILDRHGANWPKVFSEFERIRKDDTDAIADLALENFIEMRDLVGDPRFLFRKKVELALQTKYPRRFVPKYSMVTFRRIPYAVARSRGVIQDRLLASLCHTANSLDEIDWDAAEKLVESELAPLEDHCGSRCL